MRNFFVSSLLILLFACFTSAAEPQIWTVNSRADILRGDAVSVSIDANGNISPAPKLTELYKTEQPYVWSSTVDQNGNVFLGTGPEGRIFKVNSAGSGALFCDLDELNVSAVVVAKNGDLYAATSPDGKVYKVAANGTAAVYFEPKEKYIWSMALLDDGSLVVGTGESGKIYKVRSANAAPGSSLMFDTSETHIISLAADRSGNVYAGTDPGGLVLKFGPDGKPFGSLDSPLREIHELAVGPDGSVYALALGESASVAKQPEPSTTATPEVKTASVTKAAQLTPPAPAKSRYDLTGAKSAVYRILPNGGNDIIWSSSTITGFSVYPHQTGNGVLLGTSDRGRIYSVRNDGGETLALQTDANQISKIFSRGSDLYAASSNQGRLFKIGAGTVDRGIYESEVFDAKTTAAYGNIWWSSTGNVTIETRSGNSESPNETWSEWNTIRGESSRGPTANPAAQFFQWRAVLVGPTATLREVNVALITRNIAPEVGSVQVLPPNVGLLANPAIQLDPNIDSSGLDPSAFGIVIAPQQPRRVYQRGARSFQWSGDDRNGDKLRYSIYYKEAADTEFKLVKGDTEDTFITLDGLSLADGRYVLKIVASDAASNPPGLELSSEYLSEEFGIDNAQPVIALSGPPQVSGERGRVVFAATDKGSYIARAEYSIDGGPWLAVYPDDGISDGPSERYTVDIPMLGLKEVSVTLRAFDAGGNIGNTRAMIKR